MKCPLINQHPHVILSKCEPWLPVEGKGTKVTQLAGISAFFKNKQIHISPALSCTSLDVLSFLFHVTYPGDHHIAGKRYFIFYCSIVVDCGDVLVYFSVTCHSYRVTTFRLNFLNSAHFRPLQLLFNPRLTPLRYSARRLPDTPASPLLTRELLSLFIQLASFPYI